MLYLEEDGDLFEVPSDFVLVQCISQDCRMGAGIAVLFRKNYQGIREFCLEQKPSIGQAILFESIKHNVFNLITKRWYYEKPTYKTLETSLIGMKRQVELLGIKKLAMPKIACGLDNLSWPKVRDTIKGIFGEIDVEILVRTG